VTALKLEQETPVSSLSPELTKSYGALLAPLKPGAGMTPNGRVVSDGYYGKV
jgi:hypothetical protein